jgi:bromodomain-containing protein 8
VLTEIEEIRSGQWDERIKASLGIVSPEPSHDAPAAKETPEVEEPTNEIEDVSMIDTEPPGRQDDPIVVDDSDAPTDEPPVAQQITQVLEEEEVDLHLTPNSVPPSPKPAEGTNDVQETASEVPVQAAQMEAGLHSPSTEQDPGEQDPGEQDLGEQEVEGSFRVLSTLFDSLTYTRR